VSKFTKTQNRTLNFIENYITQSEVGSIFNEEREINQKKDHYGEESKDYRGTDRNS